MVPTVPIVARQVERIANYLSSNELKCCDAVRPAQLNELIVAFGLFQYLWIPVPGMFANGKAYLLSFLWFDVLLVNLLGNDIAQHIYMN